MTRSSRGGRPPGFSGVANSDSSAASSSRSGSLIATFHLKPHEGRCALGHTSFPCILRIECRDAPALLFELDRAHSQILGLLGGQAGALRGDGLCNLSEAVLAHGLSEDGV